MKIAILLDHDLEGRQVFLEAALHETGWDNDLNIEFKRLRASTYVKIHLTARFGISFNVNGFC